MSAPLPRRVLVVGLGKTGLSVIRWLLSEGCDVSAVDTRANPPGLDVLRQQYPEVAVYAGGLPQRIFEHIDMMVVSPGISIRTEEIAEARANGVELVGDVELFARANTKPVIAITGSNGKSTVTELAAAMLNEAGVKATAAGNIGLPVLDLLDTDYDAAVLELSSFQLETTRSLRSAAAVVLNVSEDHMDRYDDPGEYAAAKAGIYRNCDRAVLNRDDPAVMNMARGGLAESVSFGLSSPQDAGDFGRMEIDNELWLVKGDQPLLRVDELAMPGSHNQANVLAALALVEKLGVAPDQAVDTARRFTGLAHRCRLVLTYGGVSWINDSKATNVGATAAALQGMTRPVILIAGGDAKGADFAPLAPLVKKHVKALILLGRDKQLLAEALADAAPVSRVDDMRQAVKLADDLAESGDLVMLSPACASLDMYRNFAERGEHFETLARGLAS